MLMPTTAKIKEANVSIVIALRDTALLLAEIAQRLDPIFDAVKTAVRQKGATANTHNAHLVITLFPTLLEPVLLLALTSNAALATNANP